MAIEKVVEIKVDADQANKEVSKLEAAIERLADAQEEANQQQKKSAEDAKKALEEQKQAAIAARKPLARLKTGFKALGGAIKATGIGLLVAAFLGLK